MHKNIRIIIVFMIILSFFIIPVNANIIVKIFDPYNSDVRYDIYYQNGTLFQGEFYTNSSASLVENNTYIFVVSKNYLDFSNPQSIIRYFMGIFGTVFLIVCILIVVGYKKNKRR